MDCECPILSLITLEIAPRCYVGGNFAILLNNNGNLRVEVIDVPSTRLF